MFARLKAEKVIALILESLSRDSEQAESLEESCQRMCSNHQGDDVRHAACMEMCVGPSTAELEQAERIRIALKSIADCKARIGYPHSVLCGDDAEVCKCAEEHEAWVEERSAQLEFCMAMVPWSELSTVKGWGYDRCEDETSQSLSVQAFCKCLSSEDE